MELSRKAFGGTWKDSIGAFCACSMIPIGDLAIGLSGSSFSGHEDGGAVRRMVRQWSGNS